MRSWGFSKPSKPTGPLFLDQFGLLENLQMSGNIAMALTDGVGDFANAKIPETEFRSHKMAKTSLVSQCLELFDVQVHIICSYIPIYEYNKDKKLLSSLFKTFIS